MGWIINQLIGNVSSAVLNIIVDIIEFFMSLFKNMFGTSPEAFLKIFPIVSSFNEIFIAIGTGLVIVFFMFGTFRNMFSGLGFLGESPFKMVIRTLIAFCGVYLMGTGMSWVYSGTAGEGGVFSSMYDAVASVNSDISGFSSGFESTLFDPLVGATSGAISIFMIIVFVMIGINFFKLFLEMVERYLMVNMLVLFAPMAASAITLESTLKVFQSYIKMFFGQLMMLIMNLVSLKIIQSGLQFAANTFTDSSLLTIEGVDSIFIPVIVLVVVLAMMKIAQKLDNYMRDIGMIVGINGGNLMDEIMATGKLASPAVGAITKGYGGIAKGVGSGVAGAAGVIGGSIMAKKLSNAGVKGILGGATDGISSRAIKSEAQTMMGTAGSPLSGLSKEQAYGAVAISHGAGNYMSSMNNAIPLTAAAIGSKSMINSFKLASEGFKKTNGGSIESLSNLDNVKIGQGGGGGFIKSTIQNDDGSMENTSQFIAFSTTAPEYKGSTYTTFRTPDGEHTIHAWDPAVNDKEFLAANKGKSYDIGSPGERAFSAYNAGKSYSSGETTFANMGDSPKEIQNKHYSASGSSGGVAVDNSVVSSGYVNNQSSVDVVSQNVNASTVSGDTVIANDTPASAPYVPPAETVIPNDIASPVAPNIENTTVENNSFVNNVSQPSVINNENVNNSSVISNNETPKFNKNK